MSENDEIEKRMIRAWAFNPDDLAFNQLGELSERQKRWLQFEIVGWSLQIAIEVVLIISAWVFFYLQSQYNFGSVWWAGGAFWTVALGWPIYMCLQNIRPILADLRKNEVRVLTGTISKNTSFIMRRGRANVANWNIEIKDYQFGILPFVYASLIDHQSYRVFYTPTLQRVINIEPLFHADAKQNEENPT